MSAQRCGYHIILCAVMAVLNSASSQAQTQAQKSAQNSAQTIISEWGSLAFPPAPELKPAKIDPATTALLLFDFTRQTCTPERRPRCAASVPKLKALHDAARAHNMLVVYSIATPDSTPADILPEFAPKAGETVLPPLGPDKFINSDLEKMLRDKGIKSVIITGTAANTTVLHTGGAAALRGFKVIVPVDAMSSNEAFTEAYTAWHMANAARISAATTLTRVDLISY
jgi:nicotinamidase-related amidase